MFLLLNEKSLKLLNDLTRQITHRSTNKTPMAVEPPCATTSDKPNPSWSDYLSKTQNFSSQTQSFIVGTPRKLSRTLFRMTV